MPEQVELWDVYTKHRERTNRLWQRGTRLHEGDCHLVVHVCLFNRQGEMLIQQRTSDKENWANGWDVTVAGNALAGETSRQAAMRELEEEIGFAIDMTNMRPHLTFHSDGVLDDIYLIETEVDIHALTLQPSEVQAVRWAEEKTVFELMELGHFIPYKRAMLSLLFAMRHRYGSFRQVDQGGQLNVENVSMDQ